jgi:hypothetical protein
VYFAGENQSNAHRENPYNMRAVNQYNHQIELLMCDLSRSGKSAYTTTGTRLNVAATEMGRVYDKLYTSFSGAVNRNSSDDGSRESSYLEKSEVCGLELLSSNYEDDNDNEEHDDLDSIEEEGVYIPPCKCV